MANHQRGHALYTTLTLLMTAFFFREYDGLLCYGCCDIVTNEVYLDHV